MLLLLRLAKTKIKSIGTLESKRYVHDVSTDIGHPQVEFNVCCAKVKHGMKQEMQEQVNIVS